MNGLADRGGHHPVTQRRHGPQRQLTPRGVSDGAEKTAVAGLAAGCRQGVAHARPRRVADQVGSSADRPHSERPVGTRDVGVGGEERREDPGAADRGVRDAQDRPRDGAGQPVRVGDRDAADQVGQPPALGDPAEHAVDHRRPLGEPDQQHRTLRAPGDPVGDQGDCGTRAVEDRLPPGPDPVLRDRAEGVLVGAPLVREDRGRGKRSERDPGDRDGATASLRARDHLAYDGVDGGPEGVSRRGLLAVAVEADHQGVRAPGGAQFGGDGLRPGRVGRARGPGGDRDGDHEGDGHHHSTSDETPVTQRSPLPPHHLRGPGGSGRRGPRGGRRYRARAPRRPCRSGGAATPLARA